jgi:hypothetical protein
MTTIELLGDIKPTSLIAQVRPKKTKDHAPRLPHLL